MVRTSDFQFENGGSIPPSPILRDIELIHKTQILINNKNERLQNIKYCFLFVSIISPFLINNTRLLFDNPRQDKKKIAVKQSYVLLTWFYYLTFLNQNTGGKNKLRFAVLPIKRKIFTLTRAPMAHKNWSKEQYKFQFHKFKISFKSNLKTGNSLKSLNAGLLFVILSKRFFPHFETNLLFLKTACIYLHVRDFVYFDYNNTLNFL